MREPYYKQATSSKQAILVSIVKLDKFTLGLTCLAHLVGTHVSPVMLCRLQLQNHH